MSLFCFTSREKGEDENEINCCLAEEQAGHHRDLK